MPTTDLLGSAGESGWKGEGYVAACGLLGLDESPWATYRRTKPMNALDLANLLKPNGIAPDYEDQGGRCGQRGYFRSDIEAAVGRWLQVGGIFIATIGIQLIPSGLAGYIEGLN